MVQFCQLNYMNRLFDIYICIYIYFSEMSYGKLFMLFILLSRFRRCTLRSFTGNIHWDFEPNQTV